MNAAQRYTLRGLLIAAIAGAFLVVGLLYVEGHAVVVGGNSTISELVWLAWASQPGAIFIVSHMLAAPFWYLMGHLLWQSKVTYEQIRKGGL